MSNKTSTHKPDYTWLNQIGAIYQADQMHLVRVTFRITEWRLHRNNWRKPNILTLLKKLLSDVSWRHVCGLRLVRLLSIFSSSVVPLNRNRWNGQRNRPQNCEKRHQPPQHAFCQVFNLLEQEKQVFEAELELVTAVWSLRPGGGQLKTCGINQSKIKYQIDLEKGKSFSHKSPNIVVEPTKEVFVYSLYTFGPRLTPTSLH